MVRGAREELAVIQAYARRANKRVRYNTLDWFDKIEARQRRVLLESACVWRTAGPNAAALYLLLGQRARSRDDESDVPLPTIIDRLKAWMDAHPETLATLRDIDHDANYLAGRWLAEWSTYRWMLHMNCKGIAPSTSSLFLEYSAQFPPSLLGPRARLRLNKMKTEKQKMRDWASQYRRRWGVKHGRLQPGTCLSCQEIRDKVGCSVSLRSIPFFLFGRWPFIWDGRNGYSRLRSWARMW